MDGGSTASHREEGINGFGNNGFDNNGFDESADAKAVGERILAD
jgi:hypothetical protein